MPSILEEINELLEYFEETSLSADKDLAGILDHVDDLMKGKGTSSSAKPQSGKNTTPVSTKKAQENNEPSNRRSSKPSALDDIGKLRDALEEDGRKRNEQKLRERQGNAPKPQAASNITSVISVSPNAKVATKDKIETISEYYENVVTLRKKIEALRSLDESIVPNLDDIIKNAISTYNRSIEELVKASENNIPKELEEYGNFMLKTFARA